jgi:DNA-binding helix-hairpin-helix protein with protein kinase domain
MYPSSTFYPSPAVPTSLTCSTTGQAIALTQQIARSGEGEVWRTDRDGYLAKRYHTPSPQRIRKLEVMIANSPQDPNAGMNHISFAWPRSLLRDASGNCVGFLMPAIVHSVELLDVYNPRRRQIVLPGFNWLYLHTTALNLASIIRAIHTKGYVLGDIKPQNVLVNNRALPAIIDTDSFQVRHPETGELYRCPVGSEGFTPPELLGQDLSLIEQIEAHDRFRLAIMIHLLLFGDHPFKGKWIGEGESPDPTELLRCGFWPYASHKLIQPGPLTIPLEIVHPAIQACFLRCFNTGHSNPMLRPTAREWYEALKLGIADLTQCRKDKRHYYSQTSGKCYWCDRKKKLGVDIFSTSSTVPRRTSVKTGSPIAALPGQILQRVPTAFRKSPVSIGLPRSSTAPAAQPTSTTTAMPNPRQPLQAPQVMPLIQTAVNQRRTVWIGLGSVAGGAGVLLGLPAFLGNSGMNQSEINLTIVGLVLCSGLVAAGFLLSKMLEKINKQNARKN